MHARNAFLKSLDYARQRCCSPWSSFRSYSKRSFYLKTDRSRTWMFFFSSTLHWMKNASLTRDFDSHDDKTFECDFIFVNVEYRKIYSSNSFRGQLVLIEMNAYSIPSCICGKNNRLKSLPIRSFTFHDWLLTEKCFFFLFKRGRAPGSRGTWKKNIIAVYR